MSAIKFKPRPSITLDPPKQEEINDSLQQAWAATNAICYIEDECEIMVPLAEVAADLIKKVARELGELG